MLKCICVCLFADLANSVRIQRAEIATCGDVLSRCKLAFFYFHVLHDYQLLMIQFYRHQAFPILLLTLEF